MLLMNSPVLNSVKYRYTLESGDHFKDAFLYYYSERESVGDFNMRKQVTPCPSFARNELQHICDRISSRLIDISREGGGVSYSRAVQGLDRGVDLKNNSLDFFISNQILLELLGMGRVAVFVDSPRDPGITRAEARGQHPYIYTYKSEQIIELEYDIYGTLIKAILLDIMPDNSQQYRTLTLLPDGVLLTVGQTKTSDPVEGITLNLRQIPLVVLDIGSSLLKDIVDYQIALLNLESSDIGFAIVSNFPFYTEQGDQNDIHYGKTPDGEAPNVKAGPTKGRRYPRNTDRPGFINPSPEPLKASMLKQDQIRASIKELLGANLDNLTGQSISGINVIIGELIRMERELAYHWHAYENARSKVQISYPNDFTILTDAQRLDLAKQKSQYTLPSITYRREAAKQIASLVLGPLPASVLKQIESEIDNSLVVNLSTADTRDDVVEGILDKASAAAANAYPPGVVEKAEKEHIERLAEIAAAQSVGDATANRIAQDKIELSPDGKRHVRGKGVK